MGLFDFFRKKEEVDFEEEKGLGKILQKGIYFEDTKQFLKWGAPVKELAK
jgi:hypothetical protein